MSGPELKPCPFCGGAAEIVNIDEGENAGGSCVRCTRCMASGNVEFGRKENFVSNWNRRDTAVLASLPEVQAMIAANYRKLVAEITGNPSGTKCDACRACGYYHCADAFYGCPGMRDYTLEEATAVLARIEREAEARGMVKGMREAATLLREQGYGTAPKQILARAEQVDMVASPLQTAIPSTDKAP